MFKKKNIFTGTFMAVIRGYTRQSVSAFRLASVMAFSFIMTAYPGLVGGLQFYEDNDFKDFDKCKSFFTTYPQTVGFGYPSDHEGSDFCKVLLNCTFLVIIL
jgi:hypothetical protein